MSFSVTYMEAEVWSCGQGGEEAPRPLLRITPFPLLLQLFLLPLQENTSNIVARIVCQLDLLV